MSRSNRAPIVTEGYGRPDKKRRKRKANRKVRAAPGEKEIASGGAFKKVSNSWDICDWKIKISGKKANRK